MKTFYINYALMLLVLSAIWFGLWLIMKGAKKKQYEQDYVYCAAAVRELKADRKSYEFLLRELHLLSQNNQDRTRTLELFGQFRDKYKRFIDEDYK